MYEAFKEGVNTMHYPKTTEEINLHDLHQLLYTSEFWEKTLQRMKNKQHPISDELSMELDSLIFSQKYKDIVDRIFLNEYKWSIPEKVLLAKVGTTKKRTVYMYSEFDRFVIGAIYRGMNEYFQHLFYPNCFSYRPNVTTKSAIMYISNMKQNNGLYGLKMDISAYFNSVNQEHLITCLTELFGEESSLRRSLDKIFLDDTVLFNGYQIKEYKSLIPGTALGSFFANYCLRDLDKYFYDNNIIYARYSDDIIILDETPDLINKHLDFIKEHLNQYGLTINPNKYVHFQPEDEVDYLGLTLSDRGIDISPHTKRKLKKTIKRWVKKARKDIEMGNTTFNKVAYRLVNRLNWKLYKSYIEDETKFGWAFYVFRYVTVTESLKEIDHYLRDQLRYLKTGKHNKANVKALNNEDFQQLGVLSLYEMYHLFKLDLDYYKEVIAVLKP